MNASRTRIKICGLTRAQDLHEAAQAGADALGFVFYPPSKRNLTIEQAAALSIQVPAFVSTVALFVNPDTALVQEVLARVRPTVLQFHGDETPVQCTAYGVPYLKAFRLGAPGLDTPEGVVRTCQQYPGAAGWLFDSYTPAYGGSGQTFDQSLLSGLAQLGDHARPCIVSGGLLAETVGAALVRMRPWAVDVSSGVEASPGLKSTERMRAFVAAVRSADQTFAERLRDRDE